MHVDWDTSLVAPLARDLWWLGTGAGELATYTQITGRDVVEVDLKVYRLPWDLTDIASYAGGSWRLTPVPPTPRSPGVRSLILCSSNGTWPGLV